MGTMKYRCNACKNGDDIITLFQSLYNLDFTGACGKIMSICGISGSISKSTNHKTTFDYACNNGSQGQEWFKEQGFSDQVIDDFEIGTNQSWAGALRATIPFYNANSQSIGYIGYAIDGNENKTFFSKGCEKSKNLFNYHNFINHFKEYNAIYITENLLDSIRLHSFGLPSVSTLGTASWHMTISFIKNYCNTIYLVNMSDSNIYELEAYLDRTGIELHRVIISTPTEVWRMCTQDEFREAVLQTLGAYNPLLTGEATYEEAETAAKQTTTDWLSEFWASVPEEQPAAEFYPHWQRWQTQNL